MYKRKLPNNIATIKKIYDKSIILLSNNKNK